ncbi:pathogenesis-related leaf protein 6-like [Lycium barbarum]|uniref:pathogenesis-related leaf protein 6-like n=1 Tax=Lycium ferocissimum TaxID=112874 RepID=UPI002815B015|nr:pathogenesis-related leaf protein 6-like [Lycium ferocissimum]XP_060169278.1 pathogenesis-related leaf protein 6-like [Lycium barbarum]
MAFSQASFLTLLICLIMLALAFPSHAQNSQADYLNTHDSARSQVGVSAIAWNTTLANYAQNYANQRIGDCNLVHSNGPYGENIAKGSGSFTGTAAVNLWVAEKPYYDYNNNCCTGGQQCLHYTQVVWRNSIQVGCARVQCSNGWWFVICNYNPRGNYIGQLPY